MKEQKVVLKELKSQPENIPLIRIRSSFSIRNGIFTDLERIRLRTGLNSFYYDHYDKFQESQIAKIENYKIFTEAEINKDEVEIIESKSLLNLLNTIKENILNDISLLNKDDFNSNAKDIIGDRNDILIHNTSIVHSGVTLDTRNGPIVIDENTEITPYTYIEGPVYIGKNSKIDSARILGPSVLGNTVRIGGEIENSIINDFSNKHHEGFLGHSILGSWVNIGAITTTSDLKNNYGEVRITIPVGFDNNQTKSISTNTIKFGSIIGDCVKIGIGTMINTGSVLDFGSNIFNMTPNKYTKPLTWGDSSEIYKVDKFISDTSKIFARRKKRPPENLKRIVNRIKDSQ